jgi:nicotinamidase/pyrazinamidase
MTSKNSSTHLVIVDPQNDFCDLPPAHCPPSPLTQSATLPALPVTGAHADMLRLASFIRRAMPRIDDITITLDSHHRLDIAHPTFWQTASAGAVTPFTQITAAQVRAGDFAPRQAGVLPRVLAYLDGLEARGRYTLIVWPVHCEIGSWGHNIHADVRAACNVWEDAHWKQAHKINKGSNPWTEHYSAVMAEVPDENDVGTQLNRDLLASLAMAGTIYIAGEASSHCVKSTTEHLVDNLPADSFQRIVLLSDCMSPVGGFEAMQTSFFETMQKRGLVLASSTEVLALMG